MTRYRLDDMTKGWFVGAFAPSALRTDAAEVAVKSYRAGDREDRHHHKVATELTLILTGEVRMNGAAYRAGDIVRIEPGESTDFEAVTDATTVVVKVPSVAGDKYRGSPVEQVGNYYRKQIECPDRVIAWSHRSRFQTGARLVGPGPVRRLLDYGCGDGTFLAMIAGRATEAWGADVARDQLADCQRRLQHLAHLHFCHVDELNADNRQRSFDVVTCMETLEHCPEPVVAQVLAALDRLCAPGGTILISVPIETGLPFLLKYGIRTVAGWRGLSDYKYYERYSLKDAARMLTAGKRTVVHRPVYGTPGEEFCSHYGFNWRRLLDQVRQALRVDRVTFSPLPWLGGVVSSQAWFVCRPRGSGPGAAS